MEKDRKANNFFFFLENFVQQADKLAVCRQKPQKCYDQPNKTGNFFALKVGTYIEINKSGPNSCP